MIKRFVSWVLVLCTVFISRPAFADDLSTSLADQIVVIGEMNLKLSAHELRVFKRKTDRLIVATRRDDKPIAYSCLLDIQNPRHVSFVETWSSRSALEHHLDRKAFKQWYSWVKPRIDGPLSINIASKSSFKPF